MATFTLQPQLPPPVIRPLSATFPNTVTVTLFHTDLLATIRYTTDGQTPGLTTGSVYNTPMPFTVVGTYRIKAVAVRAGYGISAVASTAVAVYSTVVCGDGVAVSPTEGCDDGNVA